MLQIKEKDLAYRPECESEKRKREMRQVNHQLRQLKLENDLNVRQLEEKERQLGHVNQQSRIAKLEQQLSQGECQNSSRGKELTSFKLRWRKGTTWNE